MELVKRDRNIVWGPSIFFFVIWHTIQRKKIKIILYYYIVINGKKNQWQKREILKIFPQKAEMKYFFSLYHPFNQFYFLKDTISKTVHLCKSERFWRIITFWQEKSSLWPALWVIFTPVVSIMLTVVFTRSYHLLTSLVLLQPEYSPLAGLMFLISWMVDASQSIVGENPSLWSVIHLCARISVLSEFDCLFFSQHPTTVPLFTSYYSDST